MLNCAILMGRLTADPELKTTTNGTSVTSFRIAVERNFVRQGEERQADFIDIVAWRQTADFVTRYFHKGSMIAVQGSIQTRNYEDKNGNKRTAVEVVADGVSFCGSKAESGAAPSTPTTAPSTPTTAPSTPTTAPTSEAIEDVPPNGFSVDTATQADFEAIDDDDGYLPF